MALKIKENSGTFVIKGSIDATTVKQFKNHIEFLMHYKKDVTINIDYVDIIDKKGMETFRDLYTMSLVTNKRFFIVGNGCKEIFQDFESMLVA